LVQTGIRIKMKGMSRTTAGFTELGFTKILIVIIGAAVCLLGFDWAYATYEATEVEKVAKEAMYKDARNIGTDDQLQAIVYEKLKADPSVRVAPADIVLHIDDGKKVTGHVSFVYTVNIPFIQKGIDFHFSPEFDENLRNALNTGG